jgi:hypothetical protein
MHRLWRAVTYPIRFIWHWFVAFRKVMFVLWFGWMIWWIVDALITGHYFWWRPAVAVVFLVTILYAREEAR